MLSVEETCPNSLNSKLLRISELQHQLARAHASIKLDKIHETIKSQGVHEYQGFQGTEETHRILTGLLLLLSRKFIRFLKHSEESSKRHNRISDYEEKI